MTAAYGAIGQIGYGTRTNTTIPMPASVGSGDFLVLVHVTNDGTPAESATLPGGWDALGSAQSGDDGGGSGWRAIMGTRTATGSEPSDYTVTHASSGTAGAIIRVDGSGTLSVDVFSQNETATTSNTITATSVSPTVTDALLIYLALNWNEAALSPPTGMTERQDSTFIYIATEALAASGATGDRTQTLGGNDPWFGNLIAIKDVVGGASEPPPGGRNAIAQQPRNDEPNLYRAPVLFGGLRDPYTPPVLIPPPGGRIFVLP